MNKSSQHTSLSLLPYAKNVTSSSHRRTGKNTVLFSNKNIYKQHLKEKKSWNILFLLILKIFRNVIDIFCTPTLIQCMVQSKLWNTTELPEANKDPKKRISLPKNKIFITAVGQICHSHEQNMNSHIWTHRKITNNRT